MTGSKFAGIAMLLVAAPAYAQEGMPAHPVACPAVPAPLPAVLAGWQKRDAVKAASKFDEVAAATIMTGMGADLTLLPTPDVSYPVRPEHPGGSVSYGGLAKVNITEAGTYRVAIASGAWLELVRDGQSVTSVAHSPGPACSGVRKMVDFTLAPGTYTLEIAANGAPQLALLVTRVP